MPVFIMHILDEVMVKKKPHFFRNESTPHVPHDPNVLTLPYQPYGLTSLPSR